ncbi:hypothetical protein JI435_445540 [Parastagonospora nodorum SN15]|uniref:Uncharacterized protein n=1 Tax=Phaeosphaeria nodorum (strain SN15 / ATCC MYA-4574 / FGSC 10173) TaxID=321614 RepID=A0A7U2IAH5_PHANO|nr:hypothetical protein JI435_445540 [Parastagonospora nodorum SN15]
MPQATPRPIACLSPPLHCRNRCSRMCPAEDIFPMAVGRRSPPTTSRNVHREHRSATAHGPMSSHVNHSGARNTSAVS